MARERMEMAEKDHFAEFMNLVHKSWRVQIYLKAGNGIQPTIFRHREWVTPFTWSTYVSGCHAFFRLVGVDVCKPTWDKIRNPKWYRKGKGNGEGWLNTFNNLKHFSFVFNPFRGRVIKSATQGRMCVFPFGRGVIVCAGEGGGVD